jgi:hypothetical protein
MTDDKPKVIENVYLAEIRQEDGAQLFTWGEGENECMWLNGVQRAYGVQVGERGRLEYRCSASWCWWAFIKEVRYPRLSDF